MSNLKQKLGKPKNVLLGGSALSYLCLWYGLYKTGISVKAYNLLAIIYYLTGWSEKGYFQPGDVRKLLARERVKIGKGDIWRMTQLLWREDLIAKTETGHYILTEKALLTLNKIEPIRYNPYKNAAKKDK